MKAIASVIFLLATFAAVSVLSLPIGSSTQLILGIILIGAMMLIDVSKLQGPTRFFFLTIGSALVLRYIFWRVTSTLPPADFSIEFIAACAILAAELFCVMTFFLGVFVVVNPLNRPRAPQLADENLPTVDVFVPSYNEDEEIVAMTLAAAKAMDYPADKLNVYLLDDGSTTQKINDANEEKAAAAIERRQTMSALCDRLGVRYHTRERNEHAKAGNLNDGMRVSDGDLIVVFDADHVPAREFLRETVGHFSEDEKLFLVQTPHFFVNPDPIERNLGVHARMPSESDMFYSVIQRGLDSWGAAYFCGSAAVMRRAALEETGGFQGSSITEDCETALELHSRGWHSAYVDKPMIAGLQPETFSSFIGQRSRWCQGMLQILIMNNPLFKKGLSAAQRICYVSSAIFWFFPLSRMVFLTAPLLYIFFNLKVYNASTAEFMAYTLPYMLSLLFMQGFLFGKVRWPWISELYEYVQSLYLVRSVISVLMRPSSPSFNVTTKGISVEHDHMSELSLPFYIVFAVLLAGLAVTGYRYETEPESQTLMLAVGFWNALNLLFATLALGVISERRERRRTPRLPIAGQRGEFRSISGDQVQPVVIGDASIGGVQLIPVGPRQKPLPPGSAGTLTVNVRNSAGKTVDTITTPVYIANIRKSDDQMQYGALFSTDGAQRYQTIYNLAFADLTLLRQQRNAKQSRRFILPWTANVLRMCLQQFLRALSYLMFKRSVPKPAPVKTAAKTEESTAEAA